jgi:hypothetical protein
MQNHQESIMSLDLQRKKRAIHYALRTVLNDEEAENAVNSWVRNFSPSNSAFSGLHLFARDVCRTYGKSDRQRELVQALSRALLIKEDESAEFLVAPVPTPVTVVKVEESNSEVWVEPEVCTPEFVSFQPFLLVWLDALTQHNAQMGSACREFILGIIDDLPWSPAQQEQIIKLIKTGATLQTRPYRAGQLKTLVQHITVWMQETVGQETSTHILNHAIDEVEKSKAGIAYSPHIFFTK